MTCELGLERPAGGGEVVGPGAACRVHGDGGAAPGEAPASVRRSLVQSILSINGFGPSGFHRAEYSYE